MSESDNSLLARATELHRQGHRVEAIALFRQLLDVNPDIGVAWYQLGYLLKAEERYEEALDAYAQAIARGIEGAEEAHLNRAVILTDHLRREREAEHELRAALALNPEYVPALLNLGNLHEEHGRRDEALACYDRILALSDAQARGYLDLRVEALARSARMRPPSTLEDPMLQRLREASIDAVRFDHSVRANALFALGAAYERLGAFDLAFDSFAKANRCLLRKSGRVYDRVQDSRLTDAMIEAFAQGESDTHEQPVNQGLQPVFICGMFRSGSTLIEQVLGSHPGVTPGGELNFLLRLAAQRLAPFPQSVASLSQDRFAALAEEYLNHLRTLFPDAPDGSIVTDKRPDNYLLIGLIKRLFPSAKIVHTIRHPLGNGLSIFQQHLNPRVAGYACSLSDIGHHYGEYRRLMRHWKHLYPESIFDFDYDVFVRSPKETLLPLFAFLGLEWHDACLDFHRQRNAVKTASYWQVRQPLQQEATGRWQHYSAHLRPLRAALQDAGVEIGT